MAENHGFDSVSLTDHLVMGKTFKIIHSVPSLFHQILIGLSPNNFDNDCKPTSTIKLATAIIIAPLRNPAVLAKTLSTLDSISMEG